jgi:hypothetical protein
LEVSCIEIPQTRRLIILYTCKEAVHLRQGEGVDNELVTHQDDDLNGAVLVSRTLSDAFH